LNALVTGGTGFIGRRLVEELLRRGWNVSCLVRPGSDVAKLARFRVSLRRASYDDPGSVREAVEGMDIVFHAGAVLGATDFDTFLRGNVLPTEVLAEACLASAPRLRKFVYVSSIAAGGPSRAGRLKTELDGSRPTSLYGRSKLLAEEKLRTYAGPLPVVCIRLPNVPGVGQKETSAALGLIRRGILPIFGNGDRQTSLCFVGDAVRALLLAALRSPGRGEFYYVSDGRIYSWEEIVEALAEALRRRPVLRLRTPALLTVAKFSETAARLTRTVPLLTRDRVLSAWRDYWTFDCGLFRRELGFEPHADFKTEIRAIAAAAGTRKVDG
jgi:nucleoside-diphosphate-sugar epimerase